MKTPKIYYLKNRKHNILLIMDINNRFLQILYLTTKKAGEKRKYHKRRLERLLLSKNYILKNRTFVIMTTKKIVGFQLPPVQLKLFEYQNTLKI